MDGVDEYEPASRESKTNLRDVLAENQREAAAALQWRREQDEAREIEDTGNADEALDRYLRNAHLLSQIAEPSVPQVGDSVSGRNACEEKLDELVPHGNAASQSDCSQMAHSHTPQSAADKQMHEKQENENNQQDNTKQSSTQEEVHEILQMRNAPTASNVNVLSL